MAGSSTTAGALVERALRAALKLLEHDPNQVRRAKVAEGLAGRMRTASEEFADQRRAAFLALRDEGWSLSDLKGEFGIARARASQLMNIDTYKEGRKARGVR